MKANTFCAACQRHGLHVKGFGVSSARLLASMAASPVSCDDLPSFGMAPIVRAGFGEYQREANSYAITEQGREYLAKIEAAGLIGKGVAA